ncbi:TPA: hypothetical protein ACITFF_001838 [Salmonella enterica subsp. enterica serovar Virchow]
MDHVGSYAQKTFAYYPRTGGYPADGVGCVEISLGPNRFAYYSRTGGYPADEVRELGLASFFFWCRLSVRCQAVSPAKSKINRQSENKQTR